MKTYPLYVKGLDEHLSGGIPQHHTIILSGTPGTYKSTLAYNILLHNANTLGIHGMYVSLEQSKENLEYHLTNMGFKEPTQGGVDIMDMGKLRKLKGQFQERKREEGTLSEDISLKYSLANLKNMISNRIEKNNIELMAIDSLELMELAFKMNEPREDLFYFFNWLKDLNITTMIIAEALKDTYARHDLGFLADGIIQLRMDRLDDMSTRRFISVVKMRGVNHSTDYFVFSFKDGFFDAARAII